MSTSTPIRTSTRPRAERRDIKVFCTKPGATILLTGAVEMPLANGGSRVIEEGKKIKFQGGTQMISASELELLMEVPAFTGDMEPKIVFLDGDQDFIPSPDSSVEVVTGARSSTTGQRSPEPILGYDKMQYGAIRTALRDGKFQSVADALAYEIHGRRREGVVKLFATVLANPDIPRLPSTKAMEAADRAAGLTPDPRPGEQVEPGGPPSAPPELEDEGDDDHEDEVRAAIAAAAAAAPAGPIDEAPSEPVPGEGVL